MNQEQEGSGSQLPTPEGIEGDGDDNAPVPTGPFRQTILQGAKPTTPRQPEWVQILLPYFTISKTEFKNGRTFFHFVCRSCPPSDKKGTIKGKGSAEVERHLKIHTDLWGQYKNDKSSLEETKKARRGKAFQIKDIPSYPLVLDQQDEEEFLEVIGPGGEGGSQISNVEEEEEEGQSQDVMVGLSGLTRNPCLAHLIQLAIKDAVASSDFVSKLLKMANDIITWFCTHPHYYTKLKHANGNLALVRPCVTRWNSQFYCLDRLLKKHNGKTLLWWINKILREAALESTSSKQKPPPPPFENRKELSFVRRLLLPLTVLTNDLQGDKVTASLAIPGIIKATKEIEAVEVRASTPKELQDFKKILLASFLERTTKNGSDEDSEFLGRVGRVRNIVKVNVPYNNNFILATVLDPRIKLLPFEGMGDGSKMESKLPTSGYVKSALEDEVKKYRPIPNLGEDVQIVESDEPATITAPPKKKAKSSVLNWMISSTPPSRPNAPNVEVEEYFKLAQLDVEECPLLFWKANSKRFPILSALAAQYITMPASSGTVERLFSIAGAIARARRARLTTANLEQLLTCRQNFVNQEDSEDCKSCDDYMVFDSETDEDLSDGEASERNELHDPGDDDDILDD